MTKINVNYGVEGCWKCAGNETFERLASVGMIANFMVFLVTQFHMDQVMASNVLSIWSGITNFAPLIGAYISDAHLGRFTTIAFSTFSSFLVSSIFLSIPWTHNHIVIDKALKRYVSVYYHSFIYLSYWLYSSLKKLHGYVTQIKAPMILVVDYQIMRGSVIVRLENRLTFFHCVSTTTSTLISWNLIY